MTILGFTGTRVGMTPVQLAHVASRVRHPTTSEVHHGDCVGADAEVHRVALLAHRKVVVHPPNDPKLRAWCAGDCDVEVRTARSYLDRKPRDRGRLHAPSRGTRRCLRARSFGYLGHGSLREEDRPFDHDRLARRKGDPRVTTVGDAERALLLGLLCVVLAELQSGLIVLVWSALAVTFSVLCWVRYYLAMRRR